MVGIAYLAISLALAVFARRRGDLAFRPVFWCLAAFARACRPSLPGLFITGYAGTALDDVRFGPGVDTIHKPFGLNVLATKVKAMLAKAAPASPEH